MTGAFIFYAIFTSPIMKNIIRRNFIMTMIGIALIVLGVLMIIKDGDNGKKKDD